MSDPWDEPTPAAAAPVDPWDEPVERPKTSAVWAGVRGALQGASKGYSDEAAGKIDSLIGSETYAQARDRIRAENAAHKKDHPWIYGAAEVGGGLVVDALLGIGKGTAPASVGRVATSAAVQGGVQGYGLSDATDAAGVMRDTLTGAAIGRVVGGVAAKGAKLFTGSKIGATGATVAEERASKMLVGESLDGSGAVARKRILAAGSIGASEEKAQYLGQEIFEDAVLRKAAPKGPIILGKALEKRTAEVGGQLAKPYEVVDKATGGVRISNVVDHINQRIDDLKGTTGTQLERDSLSEVLKDFMETSAHKLKKSLNDPELLGAYVPTTHLRELTTKQQSIASNTLGQIIESTASKIRSDIAGDVKAVLDNHLDEAAKLSPDISRAVDSIREINARFSSLKGLQEAVRGSAGKELTNTKTFGQTLQKEAFSRDSGLGAGMSLATGSVAPLIGVIGTKLALPILEDAGKAGIVQRALLAQAARNGDSKAVLLQKLIESGVPRHVAAASVNVAFGQGWNKDVSTK